MTAHTAMTRWSNVFAVWLYRRTRGRVVGPGRGTLIGLITVPGRRTGIPRTVSIGFHRYGADYLVVGTGSGSPHEPQWFRNLRSTPRATTLIRSTATEVDVRVAEDDERDQLWKDVILVQSPWRQRYERKSGRVIPVAVLSPRDTSTVVR